eukprot:scaffold15878_cov137-Isochrysis_galbana.AAC.1
MDACASSVLPSVSTHLSLGRLARTHTRRGEGFENPQHLTQHILHALKDLDLWRKDSARGGKVELLGGDFAKDIADSSGGKDPQCGVPPVA